MLDFLSPQTVFCPISLGNPVFKRKNIASLLAWAEAEEVHVTMVIFDSLRVLTNLIKGRELDKASSLAKSASRDFERMVDRVSNGHRTEVDIRFSSQVLLDAEVLLAKERIRKWVFGHEMAFDRISEISNYTFQALNLDDTKRNRIIQFEYLIEESAVALTFIEKESVMFELYPRSESGLIDFLFESKGYGYPNKSALSSGRKFKSWQDVGIKY